MATSEHTLKLKAVLDTSQVRQQLNQIRNQANQALGSQQQRLQQSGLAGTSGIARLNNTLRNLQNSIDRLNQNLARQFNFQKTGVPPRGSNTPFLPMLGNFGKPTLGGVPELSKEYAQLAGMLKRAPGAKRVISNDILRAQLAAGYSSQQIAANAIMNFKLYETTFDTVMESMYGTGWRKRFSAGDIGKLRLKSAAADYTDLLMVHMNQDSIGQNTRLVKAKAQANPDALNRKLFGRSLIAYGASHLAMSGAEYAEAAGYSGVGKALGLGGYVTGGALAGSILGPGGMAAGAAIGGLSFALKELAEAAKKTASAMAESEQRVRSARQVQHGWLDFQRQRIDAEAAKRSDAAHFLGQQAIAESEASFYRSQLEGSVIGSADPQRLRDFENKTRQYLADKVISAEQAGARNKAADQWKDTFAQMQKAIQLADSYKDKVESIEKTNAKNLESKREELKAFEKQEGIAANLEKYAGNTAKLSDLAKTSKLNLDIAKGTYSSLLKSGDVGESGLDSLVIARTRMQQAQQEYQAYANALRQSEATDAQRAAQAAAMELKAKQDELSQLQNRLRSLSAPNLQQVASLASSGLMISKRDDEARLQVQEGFEREQTQIQRQILNKMDEIAALDTSAATYS